MQIIIIITLCILILIHNLLKNEKKAEKFIHSFILFTLIN